MDDPLASAKLQAKKQSVDEGIFEREIAHLFVWILEYERVAAEDGSNEDSKHPHRGVSCHTRPLTQDGRFCGAGLRM